MKGKITAGAALVGAALVSIKPIQYENAKLDRFHDDLAAAARVAIQHNGVPTGLGGFNASPDTYSSPADAWNTTAYAYGIIALRNAPDPEESAAISCLDYSVSTYDPKKGYAAFPDAAQTAYVEGINALDVGHNPAKANASFKKADDICMEAIKVAPDGETYIIRGYANEGN